MIRMGEYVVSYDLNPKKRQLASYHIKKILKGRSGMVQRPLKSVFITSDRELAFKLYNLISEYGTVMLHRAELITSNISEPKPRLINKVEKVLGKVGI